MKRTTLLLAVFVIGLGLGFGAAGAPGKTQAQGESEMNPIIEIRTYRLKPGSRDEFHRLVREESMPLLKRRNADVVAFGPSMDGEDAYVLIRAYDSLEALREEQESFYASHEWRNGPREAILALIEDHMSVVLDARQAGFGALTEKESR